MSKSIVDSRGGNQGNKGKAFRNTQVTEMNSFLRGEINDDKAVSTSGASVLDHSLLAVLQHRVVVTHKHKGDGNTGSASITDELQDSGSVDTIGKCNVVSGLDSRTVGNRISERNAKLDNIGTTVLEGVQDGDSLIDGGVAGSNKGNQGRSSYIAVSDTELNQR